MSLKLDFGIFIYIAILFIFFTPNNAEAACATPDVLIVLDRSGSMGNNSKWTYAVRAINTITNQYKGKLRFGLITFTTSGEPRYGIDTCVRDGVTTNCVSRLQSVLSRLGPGGGTSLVAAISSARSHLQQIYNSDSVKNRKRNVMFITDGQAGCANSQVASLQAALKVKTYVIGFGNGVDGTCLNKMAVSGRTNKYYKADNNRELNAAMKAIADASSAEVCNGVDDDCDNLIDETYPEKGRACNVPGMQGPCARSKYVCQRGRLICPPVGTGTPETCNNKDDDCDGKIDEGLNRACNTACGAGKETCSHGRWVNCNAPKPRKESCNNKDDDCDGKIDEGVPAKTCSTICGKGTETCQSGQWINCTARKPVPETCDNKDNDCDGKIDEGLSRKCSTICGRGTETCKAGQWVNCTGPKPTTEVCDGKDNDCDGKVDEELTRKCTSVCGDGKEKCSSGQWVDCDARKPIKELCNNRDDDCDGKIDNVIPTNDCQKCINGVCYKTCTTECTQGKLCEKGICLENPCARARCGNDETCEKGKCVNACTNVKCNDGEICIKGHCQGTAKKDCRTLGCPGGETCKSGKCVADPCRSVKCSGRDFCRDGKCVESCYNIVCQHDTVCKDGKCVAIPCGGKCPNGKSCYKNKCVANHKHPCAGVVCPKDEYCQEGKCLNACDSVQCPDGHTCHHGQCYGGSTPPPKDKPPIPLDENPIANTEHHVNNEHSTFTEGDNFEVPTNTVDAGNGNKADNDTGHINRTPGGCVCNSNTTPSTPFFFYLFAFLLLFVKKSRKS